MTQYGIISQMRLLILIRNTNKEVTIHHILTMTSGFDYGEDPALAPAVGGSRADFVSISQ